MNRPARIAAFLKRLRPRPAHLVALILFVTPALFVPRMWCSRGVGQWYDGDLAAQERLAAEVVRRVESGIARSDFQTGFRLYDAEWYFGSYQMAALGLLQVVRAHPETARDYVPAVEKCLDRITDDDVRLFDERAWAENPLESLDGPNGHAAYLGYFNLALGLYRLTAADAQPRFVDLSDRITAALVRRIGVSHSMLIETYPGAAWPVDNSAVIASIALHDRAAGLEASPVVAAWLARLRDDYTEPVSGLIYQCIDLDTCKPLESPRASGTALAAYFISFADEAAARRLYISLKNSCSTGFLGFGLINEYPPNVPQGRGDIDSGPVIMNLSFSGTGFALASCRIHGDRDMYARIYRTSYLVGAPLDGPSRRNYVCGGPLGNAIMLAMLTAGGQS